MGHIQQIQALRDESAKMGDEKQVALCDLALSAPEGEDIRVDGAINKCLAAIAEAEAMRDESVS